jgi:hypothetical protein
MIPAYGRWSNIENDSCGYKNAAQSWLSENKKISPFVTQPVLWLEKQGRMQLSLFGKTASIMIFAAARRV